MPSRKVTIHALDILDFHENLLKIRVRCSKGTYIRSLARDLGRMCGSVAHLQALSRTSVGNFRLEQAVTADAFDPDENLLTTAAVLRDLPNFRLLSVKKEYVGDIKQGKMLKTHFFQDIPSEDDCLLGIHDEQLELLAIAQKRNQSFSYKMVISH